MAKFHLKILMFLWSMRQYRDNLIKNGYTVFYHSIDEESFHDKYEDKLLKIIRDNDIEKLKYFEIEDNDFEDKIVNFVNKQNIYLRLFPQLFQMVEFFYLEIGQQ